MQGDLVTILLLTALWMAIIVVAISSPLPPSRAPTPCDYGYKLNGGCPHGGF